jgi:hypothetical protein
METDSETDLVMATGWGSAREMGSVTDLGLATEKVKAMGWATEMETARVMGTEMEKDLARGMD